MLGTVMNDRLHFHWNRLIEERQPGPAGRPAFPSDVRTQRAGSTFGISPAIQYARHDRSCSPGIVEREALVLSFNDVMLLIGSLFIVGLVMIPLLKRPTASPLMAAAHESEA